MKKYLVIGNPIEHSLSPNLHNYWIKKNNIDAVYDKKSIQESDIKKIIDDLKNDNISGINVTVPFKQSVIPFMDRLTSLAKQSGSVNTIYKKDKKIIGDNTDIGGFEKALRHINYDVKEKKAFILGSGGVAPSIICALKKNGISEIALCNRTKEKAEMLKKKFPDLRVINWGESINCDIVINATSLGLKKNDEINLDYFKIGTNKLFYDVIYNPNKTKFLDSAQKLDNKIENGKYMFIYQAQLAFQIWHKIQPKIDDKIHEMLRND